jgi:hypothetical protein
MVKVYVDDTRIAPEGWHQVWNIREALDFIEDNYEEITHIDFDYYLSETNNAHTGLRLLQYLKRSGLNIFHQPKENYTFHSSDSYMNEVMSNYLWDVKPKTEKKQASSLQRLRNSKGRR